MLCRHLIENPCIHSRLSLSLALAPLSLCIYIHLSRSYISCSHLIENPYVHSLSLSLSLTHTHTHSLSVSLSHTHTQTYILTHTQGLFASDGPYQQALRDVLLSYSCFRPSVGYVQVRMCGERERHTYRVTEKERQGGGKRGCVRLCIYDLRVCHSYLRLSIGYVQVRVCGE